jgi:hypothetical protein
LTKPYSTLNEIVFECSGIDYCYHLLNAIKYFGIKASADVETVQTSKISEESDFG